MEPKRRPKTLLKYVHRCLREYAIAAVIATILLIFIPSWIRIFAIYLGTLTFLVSVIAPFVADWMPKGKITIDKKAVLITGCDSGFGYMLAQKMDDIGFQVFACCLFPEQEGAQSLKKGCSSRLHIIGMDVTNDIDIQNALNYVNNNLDNNELWAVVCNAGLNDGAEISWTSTETLLKVIDVNTLGVIRVTKAFLPLVTKAKGRVVAVASAAGRYTYPGMVSYCMSKHAVISFCDGLRQEMYRYGVQVISIEPWMYKTEITNNDAILRYIKKTWDAAPEEIKQSLDPNYEVKYTKATIKFLHHSISRSPLEVVGCMEEAVTSRSPKYCYNPGTLYSRLSYWVYSRLPKPLVDVMISDICIAN